MDAAHTQALKAVFVPSDGLQVEGTPLVEGPAHGLPPGVDIGSSELQRQSMTVFAQA